MGIIEDANGNATGIQILAWKLQLLDHLNQVDTLRASLQAQQTAMQNNSDFTDQDRAEMSVLMAEVYTMIGNI